MSQLILVVGAGPGLGMSIARRFGRDGLQVALVSRNPDRHDGYLAALRDEGIAATAIAADVVDPEQARAAVATATDRFGPVDVLYYGPGAVDPTVRPDPILTTRPQDLDEAIRTAVRPALDLTALVLPGMLERKTGTLLYVTGLSAVVLLPVLGALAPASAALRTYALTLNAALPDTGVYAGALVVGGLIERGDIHRHAVAAFGPDAIPTLDPDVMAEAAAALAADRDRAEIVFDALTPAM